MSKWKKALSFLLSCLLLCGVLRFPGEAKVEVEPADFPPVVSAQGAVLMEAESGTVILGVNESTPLPMASTTKIMTALVALQLAAPTQSITVPPQAVNVEGSSIYLTEGETLTLEQLLYAVLLESANDAAVAVACGTAGSVEAFAAEMNKTAAALGLTNSHFVNPHGLDAEEHYTTAYDLAVIMRAALQNELLQTIMSTKKATIPHESTDSARLLVNHNKLLRSYEGCIGGKTGFTKRSGRCLVSAAEKGGVTLIAVTLNAPDDWNDHSAMLDYGFSQYRSVELCRAEEFLLPLAVVGGCDAYVMVSNTESLSRVLPNRELSLRSVVELPRFVYAAVSPGEILGYVRFFGDTDGDGQEECLGEAPLAACYGVERYEKTNGFWEWLKRLFGFLK
ncbi:MAG: D-alanyl-D-alanine carboxypeptidase [Clostridia bacterium]|nr:D-alanyl-D-alanine carboxypeptidase [Clostridia bacterium]